MTDPYWIVVPALVLLSLSPARQDLSFSRGSEKRCAAPGPDFYSAQRVAEGEVNSTSLDAVREGPGFMRGEFISLHLSFQTASPPHAKKKTPQTRKKTTTSHPTTPPPATHQKKSSHPLPPSGSKG